MYMYTVLSVQSARNIARTKIATHFDVILKLHTSPLPKPHSILITIITMETIFPITKVIVTVHCFVFDCKVVCKDVIWRYALGRQGRR